MELAKGNRYLCADGTANMNSISNLTGTFAAALVQRVWERSGHNESAVYNLFEKLERLNSMGQEGEVIELLELVCSTVCYDFAVEIGTAIQCPQVRTGFIVSFLSDYDDALLDLDT
jgi:hypothetical protein